MKDLVLKLLGEVENLLKRPLVRRDGTLKRSDQKVSTIIGMRRVGKTSRLFQDINQQLQGGISKERILYVNFEDERIPRGPTIIGELVDSFYELFPDNHDQRILLYFDEIQELQNWERPVRRILDHGKAQIYLTGSSSKMLSKEISTTLRGRDLSTEIWPFSFREYLRAVNFEQVLDVEIPSPKDRSLFHNQLAQYLTIGGLAESILEPDNLRADILKSYRETVIFRDLVERNHLDNIVLLRFLLNWIVRNLGARQSISKIFNQAKSLGIKTNKNTISYYLELIEDVYFGFQIKLFSPSFSKQLANPSKHYCIDPAFAQYLEVRVSDRYGASFENMIFLDLRRHGYTVHYYVTETGEEVDFIAEKSGQQQKLFQVCWDIATPETLRREKKALDQAIIETKLPGTLITPENYLKFLKDLGN